MEQVLESDEFMNLDEHGLPVEPSASDNASESYNANYKMSRFNKHMAQKIVKSTETHPNPQPSAPQNSEQNRIKPSQDDLGTP